MRSGASLRPGVEAEIRTLISTLEHTEQRLEELTQGEIDTVTDSDGRAVMLRRSHEHLRVTTALKQAAILNALPANIALVDAQGRIVTCNEAWPGFVATAGIIGDVGSNYLDSCDRRASLDPAGAGLVAAGVRAVLAGASAYYEQEYPLGDSWFLLTVTPLSSERGGGAAVMHQDVSARVAGETALRVSEMRFRLLTDSVRDVFFLMSADGGSQHYLSPAYVEVWGRTCESAYARTGAWINSIHPDDRESTYREYQRGLATGRFDLKYRIVRPDGNLRLIKSRGYPVLDEAGVLVQVAGVAEDVTESERILGELQESDRRLREMLGTVRLAALAVDVDGRITYCNDFLLQLTGWARSEVLGRDCFAVFAPPGNPTVREALATLLAGNTDVGHFENEILTRSGARRHIRWNTTVQRAGDGTIIGTASIGDDVTERKLAETKIRRLNRVHAVLSGINSLIVRVRERDDLFSEACRIAVDHGRFRAAAIAVVNADRTQLRMVASAGLGAELIAAINPRLDLADHCPGAGISATTIHWARPVVSNHVAGDPTLLGRPEFEARRIGSLVSLPLLVSGEAVGLLTLFAEEAGFFDADEMGLLSQLTADIAFAIDHISKSEQLDYLAYYDVLTGLANRSLFLERVAQSMRVASAGKEKLTVMLVDPVRFRVVNDNLGRAAGDALLVQVARWLAEHFGSADALARVGSDQFAVLLPGVTHDDDAARMVEKTLQKFAEHAFELNGSAFPLWARCGVSLYCGDGEDAETMLKHADAALQKAKSSDEPFLFYTEKMTTAVAGRLTLEGQLRQGLANNEFVLHYQPKVDLRTGAVIGSEALLRWNDPRTGLVPPLRFIPILEETGLIIEVGRWALREAIAQHLRWCDAGVVPGRVAVNVSTRQLRHRCFVADIAEAVSVDPRAAAGLELEITESMIMDDVSQSIASLSAIRAMGVTIAIDDFGTGYSSLGYLAKLPVDTLKIDRSFVFEMNTEPKGMALISTIIHLAHSLGLKVVGEGVENEEQRRFLLLLGCDQMQGYVFGSPVTAEEFSSRFANPAAAPVVPGRL